MRFLIIGGDGTLGSAMQAGLEAAGHVVDATSRRPGSPMHLDLSDDLTDWCAPQGYAVALLFAAVSSLDTCERSPEETRRVNVDNTILAAKKLLDAGTGVIFPSTSLVFNGEQPFPHETDDLSPITEYGRQKAEAEVLLRALEGNVQVIRYSKIVTLPMPLLCGWRRSLEAGEVVTPFQDMVFSPIPLDYAVESTMAIALNGGPGIWHVSGDAALSYAAAALLIAEDMGADTSLIVPKTIRESGIAAMVRGNAALDTSRLRKELGLVPPSVESTILNAVRV